MRDDPPTIPGMDWGDSAGRAPGGVPTWPTAPRLPAVSGFASWDRNPVLLFVSLVANGVLFACFVGALVLARAGVLAPPGATGPSGDHSGTSGYTLATPTITVSPTVGTGQLEVSPSSVRLGCSSGQQNQYVVLRNPGSDTVSWQVSYAGSSDSAAVTVNPSNGDLHAGSSVSLQIQLRRHASNQQGTITITDASSDNGSATLASLSYTISGC